MPGFYFTLSAPRVNKFRASCNTIRFAKNLHAIVRELRFDISNKTMQLHPENSVISTSLMSTRLYFA